MKREDLIKIINMAKYDEIKKAEITYITKDGNEIISQIIDTKKYKGDKENG